MKRNDDLTIGFRLLPHYFFLCAGFVYGLIFMVLTPPFQVPDEVNHFYRSYQIAHGHWAAETYDHRLGGFIPNCYIEAVQNHLGIKGVPFSRTNRYNLKEQFYFNGANDSLQFVDFPNTALYLPISYAPQVVTMKLSEPLHLTPVQGLYLCRLVMLMLWLIAGFYTIKRLNDYAWFFTLLLLVPMGVFINMSISADVVTNILILLWIGQIFYYRERAQPLSIRQLVFLFLLAGMLALAKYVYMPIVLLIFLLPSVCLEPYKKKTKYILYASLILFSAALAFAGSRYASGIYIPYDLYNPSVSNHVDVPWKADINGQVHFLLSHPTQLVAVFVRSFYHSYTMLIHSYVGVFGWLDTRLPWVYVLLFFLSLIAIMLYDNASTTKPWQPKERLLMGLIAAAIGYLLYISYYLSWVSVGAPYVGGIQGRYFYLILPWLLFSIGYFAWKHKALFIFALSSILLVLTASSFTLYERYYGDVIPTDDVLLCDAESTWYDNYMGVVYFNTNSANIKMSNGSSQSDEQSRSGRFSCKTTPESPYGMTTTLYGLPAGDTLHAEVWYKGEQASLCLQTQDPYNLRSTQVVTQIDEGGWKKLVLTLPIDVYSGRSGLSMYVFNNRLTYFDDARIQIKKVGHH